MDLLYNSTRLMPFVTYKNFMLHDQRPHNGEAVTIRCNVRVRAERSGNEWFLTASYGFDFGGTDLDDAPLLLNGMPPRRVIIPMGLAYSVLTPTVIDEICDFETAYTRPIATHSAWLSSKPTFGIHAMPYADEDQEFEFAWLPWDLDEDQPAPENQQPNPREWVTSAWARELRY